MHRRGVDMPSRPRFARAFCIPAHAPPPRARTASAPRTPHSSPTHATQSPPRIPTQPNQPTPPRPPTSAHPHICADARSPVSTHPDIRTPRRPHPGCTAPHFPRSRVGARNSTTHHPTFPTAAAYTRAPSHPPHSIPTQPAPAFRTRGVRAPASALPNSRIPRFRPKFPKKFPKIKEKSLDIR